MITTYTDNFLLVSPFALHLRVDDLSSDMCLQGLAVQSLHGDREQCDREEALKDFKESTLDVFVFKKKKRSKSEQSNLTKEYYLLCVSRSCSDPGRHRLGISRVGCTRHNSCL